MRLTALTVAVALAICYGAGCGRRVLTPESKPGAAPPPPKTSAARPPAGAPKPGEPARLTPESVEPAPPSLPGAKGLTEDEFVEIAARILLASEGAAVGADGRLAPEGLKDIERRTAEIIRARGFTQGQVKAFESSVEGPTNLERVNKRINERFRELKAGPADDFPPDG